MGFYMPLAVPPESLEAALRALSLLDYRGVNITVPHKEQALQLCDELDEPAQQIGAVNMVTATKDGKLRGATRTGLAFSKISETVAIGSRPMAQPWCWDPEGRRAP